MHSGVRKSGPYLLAALPQYASHEDPTVWGEESFSPREDDRQDSDITAGIHSGTPKSGPWLLEACAHYAAGNKDFHQHDWRTAQDYGHFHSNSRPPLLSDIPHPSELNLRGKGGAAIAARAAASQDPDRDPYGVLNGTGKTFDDLVRHAKEHYHNASPQQQEEGRLWYPGYSNLIQHVSDRTIKDPDKASAIFSAHSPRQNFDTNVEQGAHFLFNYDGSDPDFKASPMNMHTGKAKQIWHSPSADHDTYQQILNGAKTKSFHVNGDPRNHNLRPAREGQEDDWGYHELPVNPHTGEPDFRMHPDQQATIDTHQARAMSAPHGADLSNLRYATPADFEYEFTHNKKDINPGYDLYNRALQEATRQINAENPDVHQQLVPNQVQAVDWTKFKKDVDDAGRGADLVDPGLMPKGLQKALGRGQSEEEWAQKNPLKNPFPRYQVGDDTWVDPRRQPVPDEHRLPPFRDVLHKLKAGSVSNDGSFWGDFLGAFIEEHKASYGCEPSSLESHEEERLGPHPQHEAAIQKDWYTPIQSQTPARRTIAPRGNPYRTPSRIYRPHQMHVDAPGTPHTATQSLHMDDDEHPARYYMFPQHEHFDIHENPGADSWHQPAPWHPGDQKLSRWFVAEDDINKKKQDPQVSNEPGVTMDTPAAAVGGYVAAPPLAAPAGYSGGGGGYGGGGGSNASSDLGHGPAVTVPLNGGGMTAAEQWLNANQGRAYSYGGHANGSYDCSGGQSELYNYLTGKQPGNRNFSTTSDFKSLGFQPGYDPNSLYNIGVNPNPGMSGHMAGEFNGKNFEVGGAADKFQYGGTATGPLDPQFSQHYHLPNSMIVGYQPSSSATTPSGNPAAKTSKWYKSADVSPGSMPGGGVGAHGFNDAAPFTGTIHNQFNTGTGGQWAMAHPPGFSVGGGGGGGSPAGASGGGAASTSGSEGSAGLHYSPGSGGGNGGSVADYITQRGQQLGLNPTEIGMAQAVRVHEGLGPTGNPSMGFGPEAKGVGFNFDSNPNGAVDQFYKQYMDRMPSGLNRNDPSALSNYIWHDVHHAADPNYGPELLNSYTGPVGSPSTTSGPPGTS